MEHYSDIIPGVNDTADNVPASICTSHSEMLPSTVFVVASILEGAPFVNGIPQNTFVPPPFHMVHIHLRMPPYLHIAAFSIFFFFFQWNSPARLDLLTCLNT